MKSFIMMIRNALRSLASRATAWVKVAGRWVLQQIDVGGGESVEQPMPVQEPVEDLAAIRRVAGVLAQGHRPQPEHLVGLSDQRLAWLRQCSRIELCRILASSDARLLEHVRGERILTDVPSASGPDRPAPATRPATRAKRDDIEEAIRALEAGDTGSEWTPAL
jgi:hypothetical protein